MQNQGKQLLLAVALALGVMFAWQLVCSPPKDAQKDAQKAGSNAPVAAQVVVVPTTSPVGCNAPAAPTPGPEQKIVLTYPNVVATFSSHGGALVSWHLTDKRYDRDFTQGELLAPQGAFDVNFDCGSTFVISKGAEWKGTKLSDTQVQYVYSDDHVELTKTFTIQPNEYMVKMDVKVAVKVADDHEAHEVLAVSAYERQDPKSASSGSSRIQPRQWDSSTLKSDGENLTTPVTSILDPSGGPRYEPAIKWTGFEHPYLLVAFAPKPEPTVPAIAKHTYAAADGLMRTDLVWPSATFTKQNNVSIGAEVVGYLGPKNLDQLKNADAAAGFSTGFNTVMDLGWFGFIGKPLLWLLLKFHAVFGNWGIAIVLLTILVKLLTLYWTTKSMRSMKAMAVLGPQMKELQAKYKDDKQRLQMETMALYKQNGVNPLAGCLPILLQMPIWLALYRMLSNAGELYQQPFIHGWIDDLTSADPYYVLPIVLVVTMFAQARLTPTTVDPSQKMQQRMMQYGLPLMFGVMSFFFPAGLTLYMFTNTCLSAVHSIYMNKYDKKNMALTAQLKKSQEAAKAAKEAAAVKAAKDANAKSEAKDDADDDEDDDKVRALPAANKPKPQQRPRQGQRRKKGGRR